MDYNVYILYIGGDNMKKTTQRIVEQFPNLKEKIVEKTGKFDC